MVRWFSAILATLAGCLWAVGPVRGQAPDTSSIPRLFTAATNAHDVEAVLTLFTEGGVYKPTSGVQLIGKPVVRLGLEADFQANPYDVIVGAPELTPGQAIWQRDHTDDYARSLGVVPVRETVEALLEGSRIRALIVTRSPESEARFQAAEQTLSVVQRFQAAQNAGAVDDAVALFADDAVGTTADGTRWVGKDQIRVAVQHSWASGAFVERSRYQVTGDRVTSQGSIGSDLLRGLGIAGLQVTAEAVVRDGLIQSTTSTFSPESAARLQAAQNRAVARRFVAAFNAHDLDALLDVISPAAVSHDAQGDAHPGVEGTRGHFASLFAGSADLSMALEEVLTERDLLTARMTLSGTHTGEWLGAPPTGRGFSFSGIEVWRIQGGQIVELWSQSDQLHLLQQLGAPLP